MDERQKSDQPADSAAGIAQSKRVEDEEIKPYVLTGELGKGSFAVVYKGYHQETHEQVAIKTVSRSNLTTKLFDSLQSEIDILKSLSHRHITKLINIVKAERNIYLIMEYCSGGDLSGYIKSRGRVETLEYVPSPGAAPIYYPHPRTGGLNEIVVRSFLRQLARALKFLRHRNLVHRDIKPQNLLLKPASPEELARGHPLGVPILKIADFGFARSLPNAMMAETLCGSPLYMAPEILRYEKYDAKADLWSVGAVLYEMSVGKPPFRAQNHIQLLKKIEQSKGIKFPDEDPAAREKDPEMLIVPSDIKKLIRSLLKRFPAERASFENFFDSTAVAKSKFPRPPSGANDGDVSSSSKSAGRTASSEDQETVIIGTMKRQTQGQARILLSAETPTIDQQQASPAPELLDTKAVVVPPKFNFRRRDSGPASPSQETGNGNAARDFLRERSLEPLAPANRHLATPGSSSRPLSTEASIIPGETEEDGMLRREYVLVGDTRAIEFNQVVDEIHADRRRSTHEVQMATNFPRLEKRRSNNYITGDRTSNLTLNTNNTTFPPAPSILAPPLSASPSHGSALTRALSLASKKLFGASGPPRIYNNYFGRGISGSPRRQPILLSRVEPERDPIEEDLLTNLEELAQKTDALTGWADEIYEYVKAIPQKPLPEPARFAKQEDETDSHAERRRDGDADAEYNALTCIALYMLLMTFSQRGIDKLRVHQEGMKMRYPEGPWQISEGFDDALAWFKEHFIKCNDRATLVKSWLPENSSVRQMWLDRMVYDHALQLSRKAAKMELIDHGSSAFECERLYEESLWCLYALQDDIMQSDNPFHDEDAKTITDWISKTKARLIKCRARRETRLAEHPEDA